MAIFRKIHTTFWSDPFIQSLKDDHKLFYIYLLTNERTKQCGIYEITLKQISFDLGYSIDRVSILLKYFIKSGKIKYNDKTFELAIKNWNKFNGSTSPKIQSHVNKELETIKDKVLIEYLYSIDTTSQQEEEQEEEQEQKKEEQNKIDVPSELSGVWKDFLAMRKTIRKPATERAQKIILKKLKQLSENKINIAIEILNQSIVNSWQDIYPLKTNKNESGKSIIETDIDTARRVIEQL